MQTTRMRIGDNNNKGLILTPQNKYRSHACIPVVLYQLGSESVMSRTTCISLLLLALQLLTSSLSLHASLLNDKLPVTETQLPHNGLRELQSRLRLRRKTPKVDTSSPKEYMMHLRDSLTDTDGKPRTDTDDPTNVWCLLDKGAS